MISLRCLSAQYLNPLNPPTRPTSPQRRSHLNTPLPTQREGAALHSWAQHRVAQYAAALREHLPRITDGGALAAALEHASYCGASLARVGLDFRVRRVKGGLATTREQGRRRAGSRGLCWAASQQRRALRCVVPRAPRQKHQPPDAVLPA